jgi:putative transposase
MDKFKDKYRIPSARLQNWDYGSPGLYFITICTKDRISYFGDIILQNQTVETQNFASLQSTEIGKIAQQYWQAIPEHFPFVELDEYVLMPNHFHGILIINKPNYDGWQVNKFGPQSQNLPSIIRGYKSAVKKQATLKQIDFGWQARYFDRIIRSEKELQNIRHYILNNPNKWEQDKNNPEGILM